MAAENKDGGVKKEKGEDWAERHAFRQQKQLKEKQQQKNSWLLKRNIYPMNFFLLPREKADHYQKKGKIQTLLLDSEAERGQGSNTQDSRHAVASNHACATAHAYIIFPIPFLAQ